MKRLALMAILCLPFSVFSAEKQFGGQNMSGELKRVLVREPDITFGKAEPSVWHYKAEPNLAKARKEHDAFVALLENNGVEVVYHKKVLPNHADSIFVQDPALMTDAGAIILKMGKFLRRGEEAALKEKFKSLNIPVVFELSGSATAEGGDLIWLDEKTLAVGRGFRTNQEGVDQLKSALAPYEIKIVQVDLPYDKGEEAGLRLQTLVSVIGHKKALIYAKLLPVSFMQTLKTLGYTTIEVAEKEYSTLGANVLMLKPRLGIMLEGNPITKQRLEKAGIKILTYKGDEISEKPDTGPVFLTRPLLRENAQKV